MTPWFRKNSSIGPGPKAERERLYHGWVTLAALFIIGGTSRGIRFSFGVFFKSLEADFNLSRATTSWIFSVYMIFCGIFAILGGWAVDRYGPKKVFIIMGFCTGIALLLTSQASAPWHLFVSYSLLLAIGTGPSYSIIMSTVSRLFKERRGLVLGIAGSGIGMGQVIIAPFAAWLISHYGWHTSYLIMGLMAFFITIPCALLLKGAPRQVEDLSRGEQPAPSKLSASEQQSNSEPVEFSVLQAAKTKIFWHLILIWLLLAICLFMITTHIVPYAIDLGITPVKAAIILSLIGGMSIPGRLLMGRASDSIGRKQAATICALVMAGAMVWLTQSSNLTMLYIFAAIFGLSFGGLDPTTAALIGESFGLRHIGVIMGVFATGWGIGAAFGPPFAGYIFDAHGSYFYAFLVGVVITFIMAILAVTMPKPVIRSPLEETSGLQRQGK